MCPSLSRLPRTQLSLLVCVLLLSHHHTLTTVELSHATHPPRQDHDRARLRLRGLGGGGEGREELSWIRCKKGENIIRSSSSLLRSSMEGKKQGKEKLTEKKVEVETLGC